MEHVSLSELMSRQEDLCEELSQALCSTGPMGQSIQHPLVHEIMYHPSMNAVYNERLKFKKKYIAEAQQNDEWSKVVFLHERPWRINALHAIMLHGYVSDPSEYWPLVIEFWMDSENIHQNYELWTDLWSAEDMGCPREHGMEESELTDFATLPDEITVYRAVACEEYANGLSWTTDFDVAAGIFARHPNVTVHHQGALLITGTIPKSNVLVFLTARDEAEIVALPDTVTITNMHRLSDAEIAKSSKVIKARRGR